MFNCELKFIIDIKNCKKWMAEKLWTCAGHAHKVGTQEKKSYRFFQDQVRDM